MKDARSAAPERRRTDTLVVPGPLAPAKTAFGAAADSQPPLPTITTGSGTADGAPRERIVASTATVDSLLGEVKKPSHERLAIQERVAAGGMGTIEVAVDRALDRRIAIKTLHPHLRGTDSAVRMFLREARLTALLDHPHIVPVYDIGESSPDHLYFAMKLIEGQPLGALIRALPKGPIDTATLYSLLDVVTKVCNALAFAHSRGVIHCDVKPANVMVGEFGQVYLTDWGIARLVSTEMSPASTSSAGHATSERAPASIDEVARMPISSTGNTVIGTPGYMSPEQARGDRASLDTRSDVFLVGAMLYEIVTRRPPYASVDRLETLRLAALGTFPPPRAVVGEGAVPPELERIILRAMAAEPAERYPSIAALRADLVRFMRGGADFPQQTFVAGEEIVREGEHGHAAYIVVSGRCDVVRSSPQGREVVSSMGPGDVFGEMTILTEGPRTATVVAAEETTVLVVTSEILEQEVAALKPWMATLLKSLAVRFREVDTKSRAATPSRGHSPSRIARQVLMQLVTWGEVGGSPSSRTMRWSDLVNELEALGIASSAVLEIASPYGIVVDASADRITVADTAALAARLADER
ncbi:serine/threonine protein kinase [Labilithrix luteola]|uniref:Serine/threonine protein kinase n=1 Tax=Labilithrix luteola TaxID=1391654 RepID=A0A0K1QB01_9BACT|nr:cyclic nucleotide-binding domain-containing protein [Labilithrix luteola]AKV02966.1 serine/threonine protein kinase [Labilithrix luteola]